ncbi:MAG: hypothetical protein JW881_02755 [Spirochaetales bacterium]|nr:hypothetical protein [Spirochaetales bacterium]
MPGSIECGIFFTRVIFWNRRDNGRGQTGMKWGGRSDDTGTVLAAY